MTAKCPTCGQRLPEAPEKQLEKKIAALVISKRNNQDSWLGIYEMTRTNDIRWFDENDYGAAVGENSDSENKLRSTLSHLMDAALTNGDVPPVSSKEALQYHAVELAALLLLTGGVDAVREKSGWTWYSETQCKRDLKRITAKANELITEIAKERWALRAQKE